MYNLTVILKKKFRALDAEEEEWKWKQNGNIKNYLRI